MQKILIHSVFISWAHAMLAQHVTAKAANKPISLSIMPITPYIITDSSKP